MKSLNKFLDNLTFEQIWVGFAMFGLIAISLGAAYIFTQSGKGKDPVATPEETEKILGEVIKNNPKGIITENNTQRPSHLENPRYTPPASSSSSSSASSSSSSRAPQGNAQDPVNIQPIDPRQNAPIPLPPESVVAPNTGEYNYRHTLVQTQSGPAISQCPDYEYTGYDEGLGEVRLGEAWEYFEYFDAQHSFYKATKNNTAQELYDYYLGKYGSDIYEYYHFGGGQIYAKTLYDIPAEFDNGSNRNPDSYVASYPTSYAEGENGEVGVDTSAYFGKDVVITAIYDEGGEQYIEISAAVYVNCNSADTVMPVRRIYKVRRSDFQIVEQKTYTSTVAEENLLSSKQISGERELVNYDEIQAEFTFEYPAEEKVVNYRDYEYNPEIRANQVMNYITANQIPFVMPEDPALALTYVSGSYLPPRVENEYYWYEREFYATSESGVAAYQRQIDARNKYPSVEYSYFAQNVPGWGNRYEYTTLGVYQYRSAEDLVSERSTYPYYTVVKEEEHNYVYQLNGENQTATATELTVAFEGESPASYPGRFNFGEPRQYPDYPDSYPDSYSEPTSYPNSYPDSYPDSYAGGDGSSEGGDNGPLTFPYPYIEANEKAYYLEWLTYDFQSLAIEQSYYGALDLVAPTENHHLLTTTVDGDNYAAVRAKVLQALENDEYGYYGDD